MAEPPVVDASPLVVLAKAGELELLKLEGEPVMVPDEVAREVRAHSSDAAIHALDSQAWLKPTPSPNIPQIIQAWDLGPGESSVLAWAHAHPGAVAIIDDLAARRCCAALSLPYRGCLGLALLAKKRGLVSSARPVVEELRRAGLYLSDEVIRHAVSVVGE